VQVERNPALGIDHLVDVSHLLSGESFNKHRSILVSSGER